MSVRARARVACVRQPTARSAAGSDVTLVFCVPAQQYVGIDWDPDMKKRFYNEIEAEVRERQGERVSCCE